MINRVVRRNFFCAAPVRDDEKPLRAEIVHRATRCGRCSAPSFILHFFLILYNINELLVWLTLPPL